MTHGGENWPRINNQTTTKNIWKKTPKKTKKHQNAVVTHQQAEYPRGRGYGGWGSGPDAQQCCTDQSPAAHDYREPNPGTT